MPDPRVLKVTSYDYVSDKTTEREIDVPETWTGETIRAFLDQLCVEGTSIPDVCRGMLLVVEQLSLTALR